MSGTFSSLNGALSALRYNRVAMDVASNNIANAGTPGYARRQTVGQTLGAPSSPAIWSRWDGAQGGVEPGPVTRMVDPLLDARVRTEHGTGAGLDARATSLTRFEASLAEPGDGGIAAALSAFQAGWHDVANNPGDEAARAQLLARARTLASTIHTQADAVSNEWSDQHTRLTNLTTEVNDISSQLATLNVSLKAADLAGTDAGLLLDQRDQLALRLSELTGATTEVKGDTTVQVTIPGATGPITLVSADGTANQISVTAPATPPAKVGDPVTLTVTAPDSSVVATGVTLPEGEMGGIQQVLDQDLPGYLAKLDGFVEKLVTTVNTQHALGMDLDGNAGTDFFAVDATAPPAGLTAATIEVALTDPRTVAAADLALKDPADPSKGKLDASNADALANLDIGAGDYRQLITTFGVSVASAETMATNQGILTAQVDASREALSGINVDEEMIHLLAAQRGYEGASRVLTTLDSVLDTLINRTGVTR